MSTLNDALNAACVLLTENRYLVEALSACRRGRVSFRPEYDSELVSVEVHLNKVELEASLAANLCANTGLKALADACRRIANRIYEAQLNGPDDTCALADLSKLTTAGQEALDLACDLHSENTSRV